MRETYGYTQKVNTKKVTYRRFHICFSKIHFIIFGSEVANNNSFHCLYKMGRKTLEKIRLKTINYLFLKLIKRFS